MGIACHADVIKMTLLRLVPQTVQKKNPTIWGLSEAFKSSPRRSKETAQIPDERKKLLTKEVL